MNDPLDPAPPRDETLPDLELPDLELPDLELPDLELPDPESGGDVERELAATDDLVAPSLAQLRRPPADLGFRTHDRAADALFSRSILGAAADLLAVGWNTVRLLAADDPPTDADPDPRECPPPGHGPKKEEPSC